MATLTVYGLQTDVCVHDNTFFSCSSNLRWLRNEAYVEVWKSAVPPAASRGLASKACQSPLTSRSNFIAKIKVQQQFWPILKSPFCHGYMGNIVLYLLELDISHNYCLECHFSDCMLIFPPLGLHPFVCIWINWEFRCATTLPTWWSLSQRQGG